jgi:hypothetical protein
MCGAPRKESNEQMRVRQEWWYMPFSSTGRTNSCTTGPSGKYTLTGTLRTLYAPSFSCCDSAEVEGRPCMDTDEGGTGGGELGRFGVVVGVILDATRQ